MQEQNAEYERSFDPASLAPEPATESEEEQFVCDECGKVCSSNAGLAAHMRGHSDETFLCPVCGQECKSKGGLTRHMHAHDDEPEPEADDANPEEPLPLPLLFDLVRAEVERQAEIASGCLDGLEALLTATKKLRLAYIKKSDRLRKLQVEIQSMHDGEEED